MLNWIWLSLMLIAVACGIATGHLSDVSSAIVMSARQAVDLIIGLAGIMLFWLGMLKIAERSGLVHLFAKMMRPIMVRLFPEVPPDHPAMGAMVMNIAANMLGLANAATPFGLNAMRELDKLNPVKGRATNAMCMFLAINTSSVQLVPMTAIAYLAANGNKHPTEIMSTAFFATVCSTVVAILLAKLFEMYSERTTDDSSFAKSTTN